ncbi:MAG TPA: PH domain-containing protein [Desertimonas sp.]|nr:PH domain-containing protein [Desertimonas sp.]
MPYPKKLLNDYEELAVDLHPHWLYFVEVVLALVAAIVLGVVLVAIDAPNEVRWIALFLIIACAVWVVVRYLKWTTTNFVITSDRVIFRHGVFAKTGIEIPLERVNSVHFNQTIIERIVGAGDLLIESGSEGGQQRFTDVHNPDRIQNLIHSQMELNEKRMHHGHVAAAGAAAGAAGSVDAPPHDVTVQLERLEALRDRGTLTDEEFHEQKQRLLGR